MGAKVALAIGVLYVIAAGAVSLCFWDNLHVENHAPSATMRNLVLIWGAPLATSLAVWRSMVAYRLSEAAQKQAEVAQKGLLADRYQRAVEMTGHELASIRMGGIQALRDLAFDHSDEYRWKVLNFLSAHGMGTGKDGKFRPVDKDGKPSGEYLVNEPPDEWMAKEVIRDILEHGKRLTQGKPVGRWWRK